MSKANESASAGNAAAAAVIVLPVPFLGSVEIKDICTKIGGVFGECGRQLGQQLDNQTRDVTIRVGG